MTQEGLANVVDAMGAYERFQDHVNETSKFGFLYHSTDFSNLNTIQLGGLLSKGFMERTGIPYHPSGSAQSHRSDRASAVSEYVSLSFTNDHPMMYVAEREGRLSRTIIIRIDLRVLCFDGPVFCPCMANRKDAEFFKLEDAIARNLIDFDVLYNSNAPRNSENFARYDRARRCELLVPNCVPSALLDPN